MELIKIDNKEIELKEWKNQRVLTIHDIARVHNKDVKAIAQQFKRNKDKFVFGTDYFVVSKNEYIESFNRSQIVTASLKHMNDLEIPLFTETGYLMLSKTFRDKLSWNIQRMLVITYFNTRELARLQSEIMRKRQREIGKQARKRETDTIKLLIGYIKECKGPVFKECYIYSNYTNLSYRAFRKILGYDKNYKIDRDLLNDFELYELYEIEKIIDNEIMRNILKKSYYKNIYSICNDVLNEYIESRKALLNAVKTIAKNTNETMLGVGKNG